MAEYVFPNLPGQLQNGDKIVFTYTGSAQVFPFTGQVACMKIECFGAQGGNGGRGGYVCGEIYNMSLGRDLYVVVGGSTSSGSGGFNGGGNGSGGYGGGGASDVRTFLDGDILKLESLQSRFIVAGGGGGYDNSGLTSGPGAAGGGWVGMDGVRCKGGTQTAGGAGDGAGTNGFFGKGGSGWDCNGGGGGGWYGGGQGDGAAGGSSYAAGNVNCPIPHPEGVILTNSDTTAGINTGHGKVVFTILELGAAKKLHIRKDGNTIDIPLCRTNVNLPKPFLSLRDKESSDLLYGVLCSVDHKLASPLRFRINDKIYSVMGMMKNKG